MLRRASETWAACGSQVSDQVNTTGQGPEKGAGRQRGSLSRLIKSDSAFAKRHFSLAFLLFTDRAAALSLRDLFPLFLL
jgi:hypothetical protein